jgi:hypothetical protein
MRGTAKERIPYGAPVLCRMGDVRLASPEMANGVAKPRPKWQQRWRQDEYHEPGDWLDVEPVAGQGERDLHAIANGPIMEPLRLYLPAGKLSEVEYQHRLALQFREAGIEPQ